MAEESFIDLENKKKVMLDDKDFYYVKENPAGLTKEGIAVSYNDWARRSKNKYLQALYLSMIKMCKNVKSSGKLKDGRTILSRDENDEVTWAEWLDKNNERINRTQYDVMEK
jgi:hypothetical protein